MVRRLTKKRSNSSNRVREVRKLVRTHLTSESTGMPGIQKRLEKLEENIYTL